MKKLICELCGGNQFIKSEGVWVCEHCQTKYTLEEAKKIMVEGSVDVTLNKSNELSNYQKLAYQNFDNGNFEQASKYFDKILEINPEDWKSTFLRGICESKMSNLATFRIRDSALAAKDAVAYIEGADEKDEEKDEHILYMADMLNKITSDFKFAATTHYIEFMNLKSSASEYVERLDSCIDTFQYAFGLYNLANQTESVSQVSVALSLINCCIEICEFRDYISGYSDGKDVYSTFYLTLEARKRYLDLFDEMVSFVRKSNSNYEAPKIERREMPSKDGCYIATSVYGSYDCPEVWVLRRFRDSFLKQSLLGRVFINVYYATSPNLVRGFGKSKYFTMFWKTILDKFVGKLISYGISTEKYTD